MGGRRGREGRRRRGGSWGGSKKGVVEGDVILKGSCRALRIVGVYSVCLEKEFYGLASKSNMRKCCLSQCGQYLEYRYSAKMYYKHILLHHESRFQLVR
jgi:hypothetical protein